MSTEIKQKQTSILIEVVSNGFIVKENYEDNGQAMRMPIIASKKVFNTKKQLNNYINDNL